MKARRNRRNLKAVVGANRPHMLDVMASIVMGDNPNAWTTKDAEEAMRDCDVVDPMERANFKRGYVAGFLASIGIDRRTMKFTCDQCWQRKSAGNRSANPGREGEENRR